MSFGLYIYILIISKWDYCSSFDTQKSFSCSITSSTSHRNKTLIARSFINYNIMDAM